MKTQTAYISGPISGLTNGNFDSFQKAQRELEKNGYIVFNPHEIAIDVYNKWSKIEVVTEKQKREMWNEYMKVDLAFMLKSDCVFVLENWQASPGANVELFVAQKVGIPIYYYSDKQPFNTSFQLTKFDKIPM